ncbi:hypothetical protein Vadar_025087 [Vaccinium darrowii]|uniref:Uncharacterized protein n=1 Tax=Vaccinium darrowii TaxID=229202 RepID=A0ACB7ZLP6_9ERIC|nr:hypothetical protein Vadar_025087 [Vaccinium darrowii]
MRRSSDYYNRQPGWDTTSYDYHSHLTRMERTPTVVTDVPHYPNVHMLFNNRTKVVEYEDDNVNHNQQQQRRRQPEPPVAEAHKKVHFVEETIEIDDNGEKSEVHKKSVDEEAEGFIQNRRKNFELCKWNTFKA